MIARGVILLIGLIGMAWLATQNAGNKMTLHLFAWTLRDVEFNVILAFTFFAGLIVAAIAGWIREAQLTLALMKERKKTRKLQNELAALRNLPLDDGQDMPDQPV